MFYASVADYRLQRMRLVIGRAFIKWWPIAVCTLTCEHAIGAS